MKLLLIVHVLHFLHQVSPLSKPTVLRCRGKKKKRITLLLLFCVLCIEKENPFQQNSRAFFY